MPMFGGNLGDSSGDTRGRRADEMVGLRTRETCERAGNVTRLAALLVAACVVLHAGRLLAVDIETLLASYGVLETVAGTARIRSDTVNGWEPWMEGGPGVAAELSRPHMTTADWRGNLFIADKDGQAIRQVRPDGTIHTFAGTGEAGSNGDGPALATQLNQPNGLFTFPNGVSYLVELAANRIRRLSLDGQLSTIVEDPQPLLHGRGLWVSPDESTIFYSAGTEVRRWTKANGIETYAAGFVELGNLDVDPRDGALVVTDRGSHGVYKVREDGTRVLVAGNETVSGGGDGSLAVETALEEVRGIAFHPEGGMFLATHEGSQVWFVDDRQVIHLLLDGNDKDVHAGDGLPLGTPGKKVSEVRSVSLAPNGDLLVTEHDGGYVRRVKTTRPWQMGDVDRDRDLDDGDVDQLTAAARGQDHPQTLDLTWDGRVDDHDLRQWVATLRGTWFGDANLDGLFDSTDFLQVFQRGEYEDSLVGNSGWADGDFNGDAEFNGGDFVAAFQDGGYGLGPRPAAVPTMGAGPEPDAAEWGARSTAVPEPTGWAIWCVGGLLAIRRARRQSRLASPV